MANSGFDSCDLGAMKQQCPNGMTLTMECIPDPNNAPGPKPRCVLDALYCNYDPNNGVPAPVLAWDDQNQILQTGQGMVPIMTVFCDANTVLIRQTNQDGSIKDFPVSNMQHPDANTWTYDSPAPGQNRCIIHFTLKCAGA